MADNDGHDLTRECSSKEPSTERVCGFLFTWNNYTEDDIEYLRSEIVPLCRYIIWGKEVAPTTGTPHLQGFVYFKGKKTKKKVIEMLKGSHITKVTCDNGCAKYSMKEGDYEQHGIPPLTTKQRATKGGLQVKNDYDDAYDLAKSGRINEIPKKMLIRNYSALKRIAAETSKPDPLANWFPGGDPPNPIWHWQVELMMQLQLHPSSRKILYILDESGDRGKSDMTNYLARNHGAFVCSNGKSADIAMAYQGQRICVFDIPRPVHADKFNWTVLESLKNGMIFSSKYESGSKFFDKPHVVVFANWMPPFGTFSADRLEVITI